jgi:putative peptidoglycan lipid II flippase
MIASSRVILMTSHPLLTDVLSRPIIALIYQHRQFKAYDTAQAAAALEYYALGLTAYSSIRVLAPGFYALKDTRIPMAASALSIIINYIVATATVKYLNLGHRGLALSISAVAIVNFTVLLVFMRRKLGGIEGGSLLSTAIKVSIARPHGIGLRYVSRRMEAQPRLLLVSVSIG